MSKGFVFHAAPLGPCTVCVQRLAGSGMPATRAPLPDGRELVTLYCAHHEAGCYALAESGHIHRWVIRAGTPIEEWIAFEALLPGNISAGMVALAEQRAEQQAGAAPGLH